MENAFEITVEDKEIFKRVEKVLANLFQDVDSEKLENILENVRQIKVLFRAGDAKEVPGVVEILREDIKELYKEYRIKNIQNDILICVLKNFWMS